jgi:hypothetical protein
MLLKRKRTLLLGEPDRGKGFSNSGKETEQAPFSVVDSSFDTDSVLWSITRISLLPKTEESPESG